MLLIENKYTHTISIQFVLYNYILFWFYKLIKVQYTKSYAKITLFIYIKIIHALYAYDQNMPDTFSVIIIVTDFLFSKPFSPGFGNPQTNTVLFSGADRTSTV